MAHDWLTAKVTGGTVTQDVYWSVLLRLHERSWEDRNSAPPQENPLQCLQRSVQNEVHLYSTGHAQTGFEVAGSPLA